MELIKDRMGLTVKEEAVKTLVNELGMKESDAKNELETYLQKKEEERKRERKRAIFRMVEEEEVGKENGINR